jgi:hypothetical protein
VAARPALTALRPALRRLERVVLVFRAFFPDLGQEILRWRESTQILFFDTELDRAVPAKTIR